jgi:Domain of unknown function (DUF4440)
MNIRYIVSILAIALSLAPAGAFGQTTKTAKQAGSLPTSADASNLATAISKADEGKLVSLERNAWELVKKKDWKAFDSVLTPNFVWIDDGGIFTGRDEAVKHFGSIDLTGYDMQDVKVTAFGPDTALVSYKITEQGRAAGQPIPDKPYYVGSGYVKVGGKWLNFFTQSTLSH